MNSKPKAGRTAGNAEAELKYRTLFDQSPDGILILDQEGHIVDFNTRSHLQLGYTREEFSKLRIADIDPVETGDEIKIKFGEMLRLGKAEHDVKHKTKQGEIRDVHVIVQKIVLSGKTMLHAIWRDITQDKQAEEAIKATAAAAWEEKSKSDAILAAMGDAINIQDTRYKILYQNEVSISIYGSHVGEYCYRAFQHKDQVCGSCHLTMAFADGKIHRMEQSRTTDVGMRYYDITASPVPDAAGTIIAGIEIIRDITERKQAEANSRQSESKYRNLFESSTDGIFILDLDGNFIDVNTTAYTRLGYTKEEMLALHISKLDHPAFAPLFPERFAQIREQGVMMFETAHLRKDGAVMPVEVNARLIEYDGRTVRFSMIRDITERKKAEEALRESEKRYRILFNQSPDGILLIDTDGKVLEFNKMIHQQLGYTREEFAKLSIADIDPVESPQEIKDRIRNNLLRGGKVEFDVIHRTKQGEDRSVHVITQALTLSGRTVFHAIWRDVTDRKRADDLILRSLKEKEVLLKEIHHRVKNNMQVIYSLLNLQAKGITDKTIRTMFEEARNRVHSMALIHQKLYESTDLAHIDFKEYLKSLLAGLADTYKRHDVVYSLDMEPLVLDVNIGIPCGQIVNELVSNCLKYAFPDGRKGMIQVGINKDGKGNNVLTVADTGIGFSDSVDFRNTKSLGLQLVNVLTGQLHGKIELTKTEGTTFRITFPGTTENR